MCDAATLCRFFTPFKILFNSLTILSTNKLIFTSIFLLTTLPLSTLLIYQSIFTQQLTIQIRHLEALAHFASTQFEARHVWHESRDDAIFLIRIKALFSFPAYFISLIATLSAVHSSLSATSHGITPTVNSTINSFKPNIMRLFVTSIFVYAILFAFSSLPLFLTALTGSHLVVLVIGSGIEVYLMAVLSVGLVVSVAEERFGWDAIKTGSGLMEGNRFCGLVLSGLFVWVSSLIRSRMIGKLMDGEDSSMSFEDKLVIIVCYGFVILWSYVIMSVYYYECRKRHPIKEPHLQLDDDDQENQLSVL
ncbi:hypothetical protein L195_g008811 [Trifolium pratense]|uniref:Transmembrane protein n=1 Tax=Trifolium pratense TaxID=57577 RepID=A0A2K3PA75_TRIPR|nr:hypothetical protein L195_g008811 [Trifolium pratense]